MNKIEAMTRLHKEAFQLDVFNAIERGVPIDEEKIEEFLAKNLDDLSEGIRQYEDWEDAQLEKIVLCIADSYGFKRVDDTDQEALKLFSLIDAGREDV